MNLLITIFTFVLILTSIVLVLLVLMQKSKSDGGMGAALGGGAAEATFGADTGNVLTSATIKGAIVFFVLSLLLYLGHVHERNSAAAEAGEALPTIDAPADDSAAMTDMGADAEQAVEEAAAVTATPEPQP